MNETTQRNARRIQAILSASRGLSPLDADLHERIVRTALGVLRRDGETHAARYFLGHMEAIASGIADAEELYLRGMIAATRAAARQAIAKYDKSMRVCLCAGQEDLALRYAGMALFVLQNAATPRISALRSLLAGDIVEVFLRKRYSPLSRQRAKCGAAQCESAGDYLRQGVRSLIMAEFCFAGSPRGKRTLSILAKSLSNVEKLSAGYLLDIYRAGESLFDAASKSRTHEASSVGEPTVPESAPISEATSPDGSSAEILIAEVADSPPGDEAAHDADEPSGIHATPTIAAPTPTIALPATMPPIIDLSVEPPQSEDEIYDAE